MIQTILPTPKHTEIFDGFSTVKAAIDTDYAPFMAHLGVVVDGMERIYDISVARGSGGIRVVHDAALAANAYILDCREGVVLSASDVEGLMYGLATALHVLCPCDGGLRCERAYIEDYPEKDYRGLMVDLARCWHPARQVFCYIDLCFALKLRYLHLHFIDDERYTLPSRVLPDLPGKQHYDFAEIEAFCAYAKARGVILIPEFEAPGHARQLVARHPEIFANELDGGSGDTLATENDQPISADSLICAGKKETMDTISLLLEEICAMFPDSPYIHIGGDEAGIKVWNNCPHCRAHMAEKGLEDERELYSEFVGRVTRRVLELGRTPIVWEGFPRKGTERVPKETIVIAWESYYHLVPDLLKAGFRVINASWQPLYCVDSLKLNWGVREVLEWNVYQWRHWWPNSAAYLNPIHVEPTAQVLGAQVCTWECTYEREISAVMHKAIALSERVWTVKRLWDDETYRRRHNAMIQRVALLLAEK